MPQWGWVLVGLGLVSFLAAIAVSFRSQLMFSVRFAKILMTDQRVPRPLRWLIGCLSAIKVVPIPDFGLTRSSSSSSPCARHLLEARAPSDTGRDESSQDLKRGFSPDS